MNSNDMKKLKQTELFKFGKNRKSGLIIWIPEKLNIYYIVENGYIYFFNKEYHHNEIELSYWQVLSSIKAIEYSDYVYYKSLIQEIVKDYKIKNGVYKFFNFIRPFKEVIEIYCHIEDNKIIKFVNKCGEVLESEWLRHELERYDEFEILEYI